MAITYPYLLPNGVPVDLQNSAVEVDIYNNVVVTLASGKKVKVPCANTAIANQLKSTIYNSITGGTNVPMVSLIQWDGSPFQNLPVNIAPGSSFPFQINGTNLPTAAAYMLVNNGPIWLFTATSSTQLTTGNFAANLPAGTYDCSLYDSNNNLLADLGNVISIISS